MPYKSLETGNFENEEHGGQHIFLRVSHPLKTTIINMFKLKQPQCGVKM